MTTFLGPQVSGAESIAPDSDNNTESEITELIVARIPCSVSTIEDSVQRIPTLTLLTTDASPLYFNDEGKAAAEDAHRKWIVLDNLIGLNAPETEINAQTFVVNAAAEIAWNYAQAAHTANQDAATFATLIDRSKIRTQTSTEQAQGCRTEIKFRIGVYRYPELGAPESNAYSTDYNFVTAPNGLPILKNTFGSPQSMFYGTHRHVCRHPEGFSSPCDTEVADYDSWIAQGLTHNIITTYTTT